MTRALSLLVLVQLSACADEGAGLLPPPFLADSTRQLFFPTGIAVSPESVTPRSVFVANGNFDALYSHGTLVEIPLAAFDTAAGKTVPLSQVEGTVAGLIDSYAGLVAASPTGGAVYVASRSTSRLQRAPVVGGQLACFGSPSDCTTGSVDLGALKMKDPFAVRIENMRRPGAAAAVPVVLVTHLSPESIGRAREVSDAQVAVFADVSEAPAEGPFGAPVFQASIGQLGASSLAVEPLSGRVFVGGCFERTSPDSVVACNSSSAQLGKALNPIRSFFGESGAGANVETRGLYNLVGNANTVDLEVSSDGKRLYVATTTPSALLVVDLPAPGDPSPLVLRGLVPLADAPGQMMVLRRPTGDLLVVTATASDALLIVDPATRSVVSQIRPVGDAPFDVTSAKTPTGDRLFVTLFNECAVVAVDVPAADPSAAVIAAKIGGCP